MSGSRRKADAGEAREITILLVDDSKELRDTIKKMLLYEKDINVIDEAGTGREGVKKARELRPDIILMDINMPDMDGLEATGVISRELPTCGVIMLSVQSDTDYIRQAMRAGAWDFLPKPPGLDETINTIHATYDKVLQERARIGAIAGQVEESVLARARPGEETEAGTRAGYVLVVYSPQGGAGKTTIATSLASGLMREDIKVLLVDADLQFADVATFLNLQPQRSIVDLIEDAEDMDMEFFENTVVSTHDSGLKVLLGPPRLDLGEELMADPTTVGRILEQIAPYYDFVIVDTGSAFTAALLEIFDRATRIILVTTPTLIALRHQKFILDYFDNEMQYEHDKSLLVINRAQDERKGKSVTISTEKIGTFLSRKVVGEIPAVDERFFLRAINRGIPIIASDRNTANPPIKQLLEMADSVYNEVVGGSEEAAGETDEQAERKKRTGGIFNR